MLESRRSSEGGFLLQAMGLLLIVFTVVGLCMSMQPLEVMANKQLRAKQEIEILAQAMQRYATDLIRANSVNTSTGAPTNRLQYSLPSYSLSALWTLPAEGFVFDGGALQDNSFWKGPYLPKDLNQSGQFGFTFDQNGDPLDPWGTPYQFIPNIGDNSFEIRCNASNANGGVMSTRIDMAPVYKKETLDRISILETAWEKYLASLAGLDLVGCYDALPNNISVTTPTPAQLCADVDLTIFTALKNGGFLPDDPRLVSDAWGQYFAAYSNPADDLFTNVTFPADYDLAVNKYKKTSSGVRFKFIPTGFDSKSLDLVPLPGGATD